MESEDNNNTQHNQPAEFEIPERKIQALNTSFSVFSHQVTMRDARQIYGELRKCRLEARVGLNLERLGRLDSTRSLRSRSKIIDGNCRCRLISDALFPCCSSPSRCFPRISKCVFPLIEDEKCNCHSHQYNLARVAITLKLHFFVLSLFP